jgi:hypothetical protein
MRTRSFGLFVVLALLFAVGLPAAHAQTDLSGFARSGPVGFGGYPTWYQDKTGLAMEFCSPLNASELDGGWCLLLPPGVFAPEVFPSQFFDEHFYWAGSADASAGGSKVLLVTALEGAFAVGPVIQGDQIVFGRLRIVINPLPRSGTYRVTTPFGIYTFENQAAGAKLFFTEDIGINCPPGNFACALDSKIGPFLVPSATPGGSEMPPVSSANPTPDTDPAHFGGAFAPTPYPGTGKRYIADPARIGPVTGGRYGNSFIVDLVNPDGTTQNLFGTDNFSLMGRVFEGAMTGRVTVDRASYARTAAGAIKLDVFATALPGTQPRLPAGAPPAPVKPQLQYYDAPCVANLDAVSGAFLGWAIPTAAGVQSVQMLAKDGAPSFWGQNAPAALPSEACVVQTNAVDLNGAPTTAFFPTVVTDQISISQALYDPAQQQLTVAAASSDEQIPPTLTVTDFGDMAAGVLTVQQLIAPPAVVKVKSSARGSAEAAVTTGAGGTGGGSALPIATNDALTVAEDAAATPIAVLANDTVNGGPIPSGATLTIVSPPLRGTAAINTDNTISYKPTANLNGPDSLSYSLSINGATSNVATLAISVTPVNDAPVAVTDNFTAVAGMSAPLPVLANDVDFDGPTDIVAVNSVSQATAPAGVAASTWSVTASGGSVLFAASIAGTYTFTYTARDAANAVSAPVTSSVTVTQSETVSITLAEYRRSGARLRITGTVNPVTTPPQRMEIRWSNGTDTISLVATPTADAAGNWAIDLKGVTGIQNPDNSGANAVRVTGPNRGVATRSISFR